MNYIHIQTMPISKKKPIWILLLIVVAIIAATGWFWIWPSLQNINNTVNTLQTDKAEIKRLELQRELKPSEDFEPYANTAQELESLLVNKDNLVIIIETIESIAATEGLEYTLSASDAPAEKETTTARPAPADTKNPDQVAPENSFELTLTLSNGSLIQMMNVLNKIENLPVVINTDGIVFNKNVSEISNDDDSSDQIITSLRAIYTFTIPFST